VVQLVDLDLLENLEVLVHLDCLVTQVLVALLVQMVLKVKWA